MLSHFGSVGKCILWQRPFACSGESSQDQRPAVSPRPNIILMMADDLGWGDVGYNGNELIQTPSIDELARNGIRFNRFYAAAPVCSPTRFSCLTGRHPQRACGANSQAPKPNSQRDLTRLLILPDLGIQLISVSVRFNIQLE